MITTPVLYSRVFFGSPDQISQVRSDVRDYLDGCLLPDDMADGAVLIVSELATNAVLYSRSRDTFFIVRCEVCSSYVILEVEDLGGPWHSGQHDATRPHGLDIITALVGESWRIDEISDGGRVVWARVSSGG
jgi:anti-sigma regulatory factor (Ser/Thr protein kinase)